MNRFPAFAVSVLLHILVAATFAALISKPVFLSLIGATCASLFLTLLIGFAWGSIPTLCRAAPLIGGLLLAVGLLLASLTLMDWAVGTSPDEPLTFSGFRQYTGLIHPASSVLAFYLAPFLLTLAASITGYAAGVRLRTRKLKSSRKPFRP